MKRKLDWLLQTLHCKIVHEDDAVIQLNKPYGLLVLPDASSILQRVNA